MELNKAVLSSQKRGLTKIYHKRLERPQEYALRQSKKKWKTKLGEEIAYQMNVQGSNSAFDGRL